jgi:porin
MLGAADRDSNPVSWAVAAGLAGKGLLPGRDRDTAGLGYFCNRLQEPEVISGDRVTGSTQGLEAYYNVALARSVALSLDLQWTKSAFESVDDAIIIGLRLALRF